MKEEMGMKHEQKRGMTGEFAVSKRNNINNIRRKYNENESNVFCSADDSFGRSVGNQRARARVQDG